MNLLENNLQMNQNNSNYEVFLLEIKLPKLLMPLTSRASSYTTLLLINWAVHNFKFPGTFCLWTFVKISSLPITHPQHLPYILLFLLTCLTTFTWLNFYPSSLNFLDKPYETQAWVKHPLCAHSTFQIIQLYLTTSFQIFLTG